MLHFSPEKGLGLEHIVDDRGAMREVYRVLKPGGWAVVQSPVLEQPGTYEDPGIGRELSASAVREFALDRNERIYLVKKP